MKPQPEKEPLHQKGANGLLAEYHCALRLVELLGAAGLAVRPRLAELAQLVTTQEAKYTAELSPAQMKRAANQGTALGDYIHTQLCRTPVNLGLPADLSPAEYAVEILTTGHDTSKASSADIELVLRHARAGHALRLPISLKAYAGTTTSLGSKSAIPSLGRLFLSKPKPTEAEFVQYFGEPGQHFFDLLRDFKTVAKEFYGESDEGREFIEKYFARKGTRKVNNKLRRAELGDYFHKRRGFWSEHRFAELYAAMFELGFRRTAKSGDWTSFIEGMNFLLGMENQILTLNAIAGDDGRVTAVENSLLSTAHGRLRRALRPGVIVELRSTAESGTLQVVVREDGDEIKSLTLSIWKDATIQFKLTT